MLLCCKKMPVSSLAPYCTRRNTVVCTVFPCRTVQPFQSHTHTHSHTLSHTLSHTHTHTHLLQDSATNHMEAHSDQESASENGHDPE